MQASNSDGKLNKFDDKNELSQNKSKKTKPYIYVFQTQFVSIIKIGRSESEGDSRLEQHIRTPHHGYFFIRLLAKYEIERGKISELEKFVSKELKKNNNFKCLGNEIYFVDDSLEKNPKPYSKFISQIDEIILNTISIGDLFSPKKIEDSEILKINKQLSPYYIIENEKENENSKIAVPVIKNNSTPLVIETNNKTNNFFKYNIQNNEIIYLKYHNEFYELAVIDRDNAIVKYKDNEDTLNKIAYEISMGKGITYWNILYRSDRQTKIN